MEALSVEDLPVERFDEERDEPAAALDRHEVELRVPVAQPAHDQLGDAVGVVQEELRGEGDGVEPGLSVRLQVVVEGLGVEPDVEVQRQAPLFRRLEDGLPMGVTERGKPDALEVPAEIDAVVAHVVATLDLFHRRVDIPPRQVDERDEAVRSDGRELGLEIVVGTHACDAERRVQGDERAREEGDHVRIEDLAVDAVAVHPLQPRFGVVRRPCGGLVVVGAHERGVLVANPGAPRVPRPRRELAVDNAGVVDHMGRVVTPSLGQPARPKVGRFCDVGVDVVDQEPFQHLGRRYR